MHAFSVKYFIYIALILGVSSCSNYQQIVKNGTPQEKLDAAKKYYAIEDYLRALPLLEELIGLYYNSSEREDIVFLLASSYYGNGEYMSAGYYFNYFAETYSRSVKKEEAEYMAAICIHSQTMPHELDQTATKNAINSLQVFINKYPNSPYVIQCNEKMDELRGRLLTKVYYNAKLYHSLGYYKSAMVACQNAVDDYPDIINRDELTYLVCDAAYQYALNSIDKKQKERYDDALQKCNSFLEENGEESSYSSSVQNLKKKIIASDGYGLEADT